MNKEIKRYGWAILSDCEFFFFEVMKFRLGEFIVRMIRIIFKDLMYFGLYDFFVF